MGRDRFGVVLNSNCNQEVNYKFLKKREVAKGEGTNYGEEMGRGEREGCEGGRMRGIFFFCHSYSFIIYFSYLISIFFLCIPLYV